MKKERVGKRNGRESARLRERERERERARRCFLYNTFGFKQSLFRELAFPLPKDDRGRMNVGR